MARGTWAPLPSRKIHPVGGYGFATRLAIPDSHPMNRHGYRLIRRATRLLNFHPAVARPVAHHFHIPPDSPADVRPRTPNRPAHRKTLCSRYSPCSQAGHSSAWPLQSGAATKLTEPVKVRATSQGSEFEKALLVAKSMTGPIKGARST